MVELIIRVRPRETMDDVNIEEVRRRAATLHTWQAEVDDSRLGDAPFVTVIARTERDVAAALPELKAAFAGLTRMRAFAWLRPSQEVPIEVLEHQRLTEDEA